MGNLWVLEIYKDIYDIMNFLRKKYDIFKFSKGYVWNSPFNTLKKLYFNSWELSVIKMLLNALKFILLLYFFWLNYSLIITCTYNTTGVWICWQAQGIIQQCSQKRSVPLLLLLLWLPGPTITPSSSPIGPLSISQHFVLFSFIVAFCFALQDELLWAAAWLHKATKNPTYLNYITVNGQTLGADESDNTFSWDNKHVGARVLLSKVFWLVGPTLLLIFFISILFHNIIFSHLYVKKEIKKR